jgi:beta-lactamase class A
MLQRRTAVLLASIAPWIAFAQAPATTPVDLLETKLRTHLQAIDERLHGVIGVAAIDLVTGRTLQYNADAVFPTASTIKVPILIQAYHMARAGAFHWSDSITLQPSDSVGGSGLLQVALARGPVTLTIEDLARKMIVDSDNTATNRVIAMIGIDRVNHLIATMGMRQTRLRRIMMDTPAAIRGDENVTTPLEMARIAESIYRHKAADPADCDSMVKIMKRVPGAIRFAVPQEVEVASKTGALPGVHCEVAIVYTAQRPFVLSVYSTFLDNEENPVGEVARLFYEHFRDKLAPSNVYGNRVRDFGK